MSFVDCVLNVRPSIELCWCAVVFDLFCNVLFGLFFVLFVFLLLLRLMANKVVYIMYVLVSSYTLIMFLKLKVLTHLILKIKNVIKYFKKGVIELSLKVKCELSHIEFQVGTLH